VLIPGPLILGAQISIIAQWIAISLITVPLLLVVKAVWPRRYRNMLIPLGLGMLLILYSLTNLGIYFLASHAVPVIAGSETWARNSLTGSIIRISLGMLVSIVVVLKSLLCIKRWINVYALYLASKLLLQRLERQQVIPKDQPVVKNIRIRKPLLRVIRPRRVFQQNARLQLRPLLLADPGEF
jgi:hypothetical protein